MRAAINQFNKYFNLLVDNKTVLQFYACRTSKCHRSCSKRDLTARDLLLKLFLSRTANQNENETQFSNPISTSDFSMNLKQFFFLVYKKQEKERKIQLLTFQKYDSKRKNFLICIQMLQRTNGSSSGEKVTKGKLDIA